MGVGSLIKRSAQLIDHTAEQWLGWSYPPVTQVIDESGWHADYRTQYCQLCGDSIGEGEASESGCGTCRNEKNHLYKGIADGIVRLGPYANPLRRWILEGKFHGRNETSNHLGKMLGKQIRDAGVVDNKRTIIVPIPSPFARRMLRLVDHSRAIANGVARELHVPIRTILVQHNRPLQTSLAPSVRRKSGAIGLHVRRTMTNASLAGLHVLVVDDIRTTGSTLKAATRLLRALKPDRIICAVLAVSDDKARRLRSETNRESQQSESAAEFSTHLP